MTSIRLPTIRHDISVQAPNPASAAIFRYIEAGPSIEGELSTSLRLTVERANHFYRLNLGSGIPVEGSALHLLSVLHRFHLDLTRSEFPSAALLHAGAASTEQGHIAFVGEKGAGKSTLLAYLASLGWRVTADEHLIIRADGAIPRPRSLRIKQGALAHLGTEAAEIVRRSPSVCDWHGSKVFAVQPSAFGHEWIIKPDRIRHVVVVRANHGGRPSLRRLDHNRTLEMILPEVMMPERGKARAFGWLRAMVKAAECWELWTGRLEDIPYLFYHSLGLSI